MGRVVGLVQAFGRLGLSRGASWGNSVYVGVYAGIYAYVLEYTTITLLHLPLLL